SGAVASRRNICKKGDRAGGPHDRTRTVPRAWPVLHPHRELAEVRGGIHRTDETVPGRQHRPKQPGDLLRAAAEYVEGDGRGTASGCNCSEGCDDAHELLVVRMLRVRIRELRTRGARVAAIESRV